MNTILSISFLILSVAVLISIIGAFGMKFFVHKDNKKIEVIISDNDNSNKQN